LQVVSLEFSDFATFDASDYLRIYDGSNITDLLIADLNGDSGSQPPGGFVTTQEYMLVEFVTGAANVQRGFNATYRTRSFGNYVHK
jgi:CUB domain